MITGEAIVLEARRWLGTPYQHQASLMGVGCDCIGIVSGTGASFKMPEAEAWRADIRFRGYGPTPVPSKLLEACDLYLDRISVAVAALGDILLFTFLREPMHFGIISRSDPRYIIHAYAPIGRVVEHAIDSKWERRIVGAYRYRGKV